MSWVTKQIAIGSCIRDAAKMAEASRQGITHILNLSRFDNTKLAKLHGIRILWNYVSDDLMPKSPEVFRRGVKFAKPALAKKENKLLIHCAAGWHRAPMMALAVLGSLVRWDGSRRTPNGRSRSVVRKSASPRCTSRACSAIFGRNQGDL
jgi:predicted protein tyrosine phosphatase